MINFYFVITEIFDFSHILLNFSFAGKHENLTEKVFLSSNNHSGTIIYFLPLSKLQIVLFINFTENPAF